MIPRTINGIEAVVVKRLSMMVLLSAVSTTSWTQEIPESEFVQVRTDEGMVLSGLFGSLALRRSPPPSS
jgi:hypothetical protein